MGEDDIRQLCKERGLAVDAVRRAGPVLVIVPRSLDDLPDREAMAELSEALRSATDRRYVALAIDEVE